MRVLFMGTPELAAVCLEGVWSKPGVEVVGVVTRADTPKGRGMKLSPSPVKEFALAHDIPVFQPKTLRDGSLREPLEALDPELIVVAAYGNILPDYVLDYPKYGCVNAHGSLLPKYRGAAPIQRAILEGETLTGITAMRMDAGLDTGDIIRAYPCPIEEDDDCGTLTAKLAALAAVAMCDVIDGLEAGTVTYTPQPAQGATYAAKIGREDAVLSFNDEPRVLVNRVRALSPSPCAETTLPGGGRLKVASAKIGSTEDTGREPGTVLEADGRGAGKITVACRGGSVAVTAVIPEGKKKMTAGDFVRGRRITVGDRLG